MAKTNWANSDIVKAQDMNDIGEEINSLRTDIDNIHIPDASTTQKGIVQLTNDANSTSETLAPTAKALKAVADNAQTPLVSSTSIELGKDVPGANPIFIDFHPGATKTDYDCRILAQSGNGITGGGELSLHGKAIHFVTSGGIISVDDLKSSVSNGKNDIASAIIDKGGSASGSDTFGQLAAAITSIPGKRVAVVDVNQLTTVITVNDRLDERSARLNFAANGLGFTPGQLYAVVKMIETTESGGDVGYPQVLYGLIGYAPSLGVNLTVGTTYRSGSHFRNSAADVSFGPGSCTATFGYYAMLNVVGPRYFQGKLEKVVLIEQ